MSKISTEGVIARLTRLLCESSCIIISSHRNADPDAIASIIGLDTWIKSVCRDDNTRKTYLYIPEGMSLVSRRVLSRLGISFETTDLKVIPDLCSCTIVVVDTSSSYHIGELSRCINEMGKGLVIVDHHETGDLIGKAAIEIIQANRPSTSEIIVGLYTVLNKCPPSDIATLLLTGILYDSRRFLNVVPDTFQQVYYLVAKCKANYSSALEALAPPPQEYSERIANLKALQRSEIYRLGNDVIVALTNVGSYESSIARLLVELGADIAFVVSGDKKRSRIVARARKDIAEKLGLNLAALLSELADRIGGSGGGHALAAAATFKMSREELIDVTRDMIRNIAIRLGMTIREA